MMRFPVGRLLLPSLLLLPLALSACNRGDIPEGNSSGPVRIQPSEVGRGNAADLPGTPMRERVAVIALLNKRNGLTRDLRMKPGEGLRVGDAIVRLRACETSAPWENVPETGAFVQLDVRSPADDKWRRAFSGWVFKERPERNVVQHPIYDVWVKSCTMEWPETGADTLKLGDKGGRGDKGEGRGRAGATSASGPNASGAAAPGPSDSTARPEPSGTSATASPSADR